MDGIRGGSGIISVSASRFNSARFIGFYAPVQLGDEVIGVLRYVTSLRRADRQIMLFSLCAALVGLIVLLVVYVSGR